jgi:hypothetical protein
VKEEAWAKKSTFSVADFEDVQRSILGILAGGSKTNMSAGDRAKNG